MSLQFLVQYFEFKEDFCGNSLQRLYGHILFIILPALTDRYNSINCSTLGQFRDQLSLILALSSMARAWPNRFYKIFMLDLVILPQTTFAYHKRLSTRARYTLSSCFCSTRLSKFITYQKPARTVPLTTLKSCSKFNASSAMTPSDFCVLCF